MRKSDKDSCGNDVYVLGENGLVDFNPNIDFYEWEDYVNTSFRDLILKDPDSSLEYPIKYLNDALLGIDKSELIVIGADTGLGKTELVNNIAFHNAEKGKNVYLFSLEGDTFDVVNRERYKLFCEYIKKSNMKDVELDYRKFVMNKYDVDLTLIIKNEIDEVLKRKYRTLRVYGGHGTSGISIDRLCSHLDMLEGTPDLIVIDHIQYFNFMTSNEYSEITEMMKKLQEKKKQYRVPIILVSHLRKKGLDRGFPSNDDFHGSSNIAKQADTCIILSHVNFDEDDTYEKQISTGIYQTGIRITKSRTGLSQRIIGVVDFNLNKRKYEEEYSLAVAMPMGVKKMKAENYPKWAKHIVNIPKRSYSNG